MPIDPTLPPPQNTQDRLAERLAKIERELRTLKTFLNGGAAGQLPVVTNNPPAGRKGRIIFNSSNNKVYVDNGSTWDPQT